MAVVKPFLCVRPNGEAVSRVAALPYDVYSRREALEAVAGNPLSFLNIDRAETQFGDDVDTYDDRVYLCDRDRALLLSVSADHGRQEPDRDRRLLCRG